MPGIFLDPIQFTIPVSLADAENQTNARIFDTNNVYDDGRWLYFLCGVLFMTSIFFAYSQISSMRKPVAINEGRDVQSSSSAGQKQRKRKGVSRLSASRTRGTQEASTVEKTENLPAVAETIELEVTRDNAAE